MRRAQASLEYLITYGWAFLVIIIAIGALAYFGVLNPGRWVPDSCDFGSQLECIDWEVTEDMESIELFVRNNFGKDCWGDKTGCVGSAPTISAGATTKVGIANTDLGQTAGEKQQFILLITFRKTGPPPGQEHTLTGVLYTTTK